MGEQLGALGPQRVIEAAGEEPEEGEAPGAEPREPRKVVDKQFLVVMRHGQRIDEVRRRLRGPCGAKAVGGPIARSAAMSGGRWRGGRPGRFGCTGQTVAERLAGREGVLFIAPGWRNRGRASFPGIEAALRWGVRDPWAQRF